MAEALLANQEHLHTRIKNSFSSFKKSGSQKMTEGACLVQMERLEKLWHSFEVNHAALNESCEITGEESYYKDNLFNK